MAALPGKSPDAKSPDNVPGLGTTKSNDNLADGMPGAGMVPSNDNVAPGAPAPVPMGAGVAPLPPGAAVAPGAPMPPAAVAARPLGPPPPPKPPSQGLIRILKIVISVLCFLCTFMLFRLFQNVPQDPPLDSISYAAMVYGTPLSRAYHVSRAEVCFVVLYTILEMAGFSVIGAAVHLEVPVLYLASGGIRAAQLMVCLIIYGIFFGSGAQDVSKFSKEHVDPYVEAIAEIATSFLFSFIFIIAIYSISLVLALQVKKSIVFKKQNPDKLGI